MSKLTEIEAAMPNLSDEDLKHLERSLHALYRQRGTGIVYDDRQGIVTEEDLVESADQAFVLYDKEEQARAQRKP